MIQAYEKLDEWVMEYWPNLAAGINKRLIKLVECIQT